VALEGSRAEHQRRGSELRFALEQAQKQHARHVSLAAKGFLSQALVEQSNDLAAQQGHLLAEARSAAATDLAIKQDVVHQMQRAIDGLETGLRLVNSTVDALAVRAPVAGRLTDFHLQVGETVRPDQRIGRIDDPSRYKLTAQVDEFYLTRVTPGRRGSARIGALEYPVTVSRVYPQIKDGRFVVELLFGAAQPDSLRPGQSADTRITLGQASKSLVLPYGAFIADSGGAWAYVLAPDGEHATRRPIRIGRRSHSQVELLGGIEAGERVIVSSVAAFGKAEALQFTK
jgi:HlyD family secretion protein